MPPKESYPKARNSDGAAKPTAGELRASGAWRAYFMRRNTVPLDAAAVPFEGYELKLALMLQVIANGSVPSQALAWESHESWLGAPTVQD